MGVSAEWAARREEELRNSPHWASIQAGRDKRKAHALESMERFGNEYWKNPEYKKENPRKRLHPARAVPPAGGNRYEQMLQQMRQSFGPRPPSGNSPSTGSPGFREDNERRRKELLANYNKKKTQGYVDEFGEGYLDNEEWWESQDEPGKHGRYSDHRRSGLSHEDAIHMLQGGGPVNPKPYVPTQEWLDNLKNHFGRTGTPRRNWQTLPVSRRFTGGYKKASDYPPHPRRPAVKPHAGGYQRAENYPPPPTGQPPAPAGGKQLGGALLEQHLANPGGGTYETSPGYLAGRRTPGYESPTTLVEQDWPEDMRASAGVAGSAAPWIASHQPPAPAGTSGPRVITPLPGAIGNTPAAPSFAADLYNEGIMRRNQQNRPFRQRYRPLTQKSNSYNNYIGQIRNNLRPLGYQPINR